jgi:hypothetical protein
MYVYLAGQKFEFLRVLKCLEVAGRLNARVDLAAKAGSAHPVDSWRAARKDGFAIKLLAETPTE